MTITELLKDSDYKLTQFNLVEIRDLEKRITIKEISGKATPYINCLVRNKAIKLTPEEAVRQLYLRVLIDDYEYPVDRIALEYAFYSVVIWHLENSKHKGESYTLNSEMVTFIKRKYYDNIWND